MKYRSKLPKKHSRKVFTKGAQRVHPKNAMAGNVIMRGGIRL